MGIFDEFEEIPEPVRLEGQAGGVKPTDGSRYEVRPGPTLMWAKALDWRGHKVDSAAVHAYCRTHSRTQWTDRIPTKTLRRPGGQLEGSRADVDRWSNGLIWIVAKSGQLYSHIPKIGRFHHGSLTGSGEVKSAGMWIVENGRLLELGALDGRYKPTMEQFLDGILALKAAINASRTSLYLWFDPLATWKTLAYDEWTRLPVRELLDRYKTNPHEQRDPVMPALGRAGAARGDLYLVVGSGPYSDVDAPMLEYVV